MSETEISTEAQVQPVDDLDTFSSEFFGQKDGQDSQASEKVEQETEDKAEVTEDKAQTEDPDADEEVVEETPPKKKTVQERIDELVKQRHDAERAAEERIVKLQKEFEEKLAALQPKAPEKKSAEPSPNDLNEDGTDKYPLGEYDPAFIRDLTRFTLESERTKVKIKEEQERQQHEIETQQTVLKQSWEEKVAPAKERYPDFAEKGQDLLSSFNGIEPSYGQYLTNLLMSMDHGPDVLYYLSNNRDEAVKIINSGAQRATLALGRIEAKFIEAEQQKQVAKPKVSKAPPPAPQARGTGGGGRVSVEPDTDNLDAFEKEFFRKGK